LISKDRIEDCKVRLNKIGVPLIRAEASGGIATTLGQKKLSWFMRNITRLYRVAHGHKPLEKMDFEL
jgi:hypothetical protein